MRVEPEQEKKSEIDCFHIINQRHLLSTCTDSICYTPQTESDHPSFLIILGPSLYYTQYYCTV